MSRTMTIDRVALGLALTMATLLAACTKDPPALVAGEVREFTGTMTLIGDRHQLAHYPTAFLPAIFRVSGALLLHGPNRPNQGFRAEFIGFSNSDTGLHGRSVWTDERGDRAFSELLGREVGPGKTVTGRFVGGTGRYDGLGGGYTFTWEYITEAEEGQVAGRVSDLRGQATLASASEPSAGEAK